MEKRRNVKEIKEEEKSDLERKKRGKDYYKP